MKIHLINENTNDGICLDISADNINELSAYLNENYKFFEDFLNQNGHEISIEY